MTSKHNGTPSASLDSIDQLRQIIVASLTLKVDSIPQKHGVTSYAELTQSLKDKNLLSFHYELIVDCRDWK